MIGALNHKRRRDAPDPRQLCRLPLEFVTLQPANADANFHAGARRVFDQATGARWRLALSHPSTDQPEARRVASSRTSPTIAKRNEPAALSCRWQPSQQDGRPQSVPRCGLSRDQNRNPWISRRGTSARRGSVRRFAQAAPQDKGRSSRLRRHSQPATCQRRTARADPCRRLASIHHE